MTRGLIYAREARDDLDAVRRWLTQPGSGPTARRVLQRIRSEIRHLQQSPNQWRIGPDPGVREMPCAGGYRVLYRLDPDTGRAADVGDVLVLRIFGPGQDRCAFALS